MRLTTLPNKKNGIVDARRPVWAQYAECIVHFQSTPCIFAKEPIRDKGIRLEYMNVW